MLPPCQVQRQIINNREQGHLCLLPGNFDISNNHIKVARLNIFAIQSLADSSQYLLMQILFLGESSRLSHAYHQFDFVTSKFHDQVTKLLPRELLRLS